MPSMEEIWYTDVEGGFNDITVVARGNSLVSAKLVEKAMALAGCTLCAMKSRNLLDRRHC